MLSAHTKKGGDGQFGRNVWIWGFDLGPPVSCNVSNWVSFKPRASGPWSICDWSLQRWLSDSMADYSCRSLACELCWHGILTSQKIMTSIAWLSASFRGFRKASAGKVEGVPATGLVRADSSVPVLDSRSGAAHNTCMSCTARLLLLFLPTTCCSNQWCVSIIEGTSLLLSCIFLWWELPPFTCYSLVLFCCCSPLKLSEPNSTQRLCLVQLVYSPWPHATFLID